MVRSREEGEEGRGECVDTLQWASVKSREERGEGSAWTLCSGRPSKVGRREKRREGSAWSLCSGLPSKVGKREKGFTHRGRTAEWPCGRAHARQPRTSFFPMKKLFVSHSCPFVVLLFHLSCISCISWFIPSSTYARLNGRAGAPTRASHALPSTLFSLSYPILKQSPRKDIIWNSILWADYRICNDL